MNISDVTVTTEYSRFSGFEHVLSFDGVSVRIDVDEDGVCCVEDLSSPMDAYGNYWEIDDAMRVGMAVLTLRVLQQSIVERDGTTS